MLSDQYHSSVRNGVRVDGASAPNLWQLNAGSDSYRPLDAAVVTVEAKNANTPFAAKGLIDGEIPKPC